MKKKREKHIGVVREFGRVLDLGLEGRKSFHSEELITFPRRCDTPVRKRIIVRTFLRDFKRRPQES